MPNPMISDHTREEIAKYPDTLREVFNAVDSFAYQACHTIEGPLGEGYGGRIHPFDYDRLVQATKDSIRTLARDKSQWPGYQLRQALANAALTDTELDKITGIIEEEALARIDKATSEDRKTFREHGHHGRQYIARNSVERVIKEVLPR